MTTLYDIAVPDLRGGTSTLEPYRGQVLVVVNVASKCGFTPQYAGLQRLHEHYAGQGLSVLGFPCNQFLFQEPGGADSITACTTGYSVTFPVFGKLKVNGRRRHPLYEMLSGTPDATGRSGRVRWNFEKVLIGRDGRPLLRFRSRVTPDDPALVEAVEKALAG